MVVSLKRFVEAKREIFTEYERHGATLSGTSDYVQTRPRPRNVRFDYGPASDAELTPSQKFRVQFVAFSNEFLKDADDNIGKEHFLYKLIIDKRVKCSFPNVEIALRSTDVLNSYGHELQWRAFVFKAEIHQEEAAHDHDE